MATSFRGSEAHEVIVRGHTWQFVITKLGDLHFAIDTGQRDSYTNEWTHFPRVYRQSLTTARRMVESFADINGLDLTISG